MEMRSFRPGRMGVLSSKYRNIRNVSPDLGQMRCIRPGRKVICDKVWEYSADFDICSWKRDLFVQDEWMF
jgi:hypothetical protein